MIEQILAVFREYQWLFEIGFVLLGAFLMYIFVERILKWVLPKLQKTRFIWDQAFLKAALKPFDYFVFLFAFIHSLEIVLKRMHETINLTLLGRFEILSYTILFTWFVMRFISNIENDFVRIKIEQGKKIDRTSARALSQLFRILTIVLAGVFSMQTVGLSVSAVLTFGGAGALAVALAAKDLLGNIFGGLMIFLDRPFSVGDWISSPDKQIEGTVEHIGWRLTRIRTLDKRPLYVPNGIFSNISIQNPSRMSHRQILKKISIRYEDVTKVKLIADECEKMLKAHEEIDSSLTTKVNLIDLGDFSLVMQVYCFTKTTNAAKFYEVQQDVLISIMAIIEQNGAQCAFPSQTLYFPENGDQKRLLNE